MMPDTFETRFSGIARLYGQNALETFRRARVAVVGTGGVGSWAVEALARSGIGHLTLVDPDEICLSNVNRQLHAMDGQIGRLKTAAMAERIRAIHPQASVTEVPAFFSERNAADLLDNGFDAVLDAIDTLRHKCLLLAECKHRGIPVVTCGGAGGRRDPTRIRHADLARTTGDPMLLMVRRKLRADHGFPKSENGKTSADFGIEAVFSDEPRLFPQCDGSVTADRPPDADLRLNCDSGFGTSSPVTATFGLTAAARVLEILAAAAQSTRP